MTTEDCNFNCSYCYTQPEKKYMTWNTAREVIDHILGGKKIKNFNLYFNGGEPLLNYEIIKRSVEYIEAEKSPDLPIGYSVSTNGELLTTEMLEFFNQYHFHLEVSFDGLAQDITRKKGTFEFTQALIKKILTYPNLPLFVNSVFIPSTIELMPESVQLILDLGVKEYNFSVCMTVEWSKADLELITAQLGLVQDIILKHYQATNELPVDTLNYQEKKSIWRCSAGGSQISITPAGEVWGCQVFYELSKRHQHEQPYKGYSLGTIEDFFTRSGPGQEKVLEEYAKFSMDYFCKSDSLCFSCTEKTQCSICPPVAAYFNGELGFVPDYMCESNKIHHLAKRKLRRNLDNLNLKN